MSNRQQRLVIANAEAAVPETGQVNQAPSQGVNTERGDPPPLSSDENTLQEMVVAFEDACLKERQQAEENAIKNPDPEMELRKNLKPYFKVSVSSGV